MKSLSYRAVTALTFILLPFFGLAKHAPGAADAAKPEIPLAFVENKGQIIDQNKSPRRDIDFRVNAGGVNIFIGDGAMHYQWTEVNGMSLAAEGRLAKNSIMQSVAKAEVNTYRMDVELLGADIRAPFVAEEKLGYHENYYLPQCPDGVTASSYQKIVYRNVYPDIDWVLYTDAEKSVLKYDFIVHAGGDAAQIKLKYSGAVLQKTEDGGVLAQTPMGQVAEDKPYTYESATGNEVASEFNLKDNVLAFTVAAHEGDVVIDPQLHWSSYVGSVGTEYGLCVAADNKGEAYVAGMTLSTSSFASFGSHQYSYGGGPQDGYVAKVREDGLTDWITYYGGSGFDQINDIVCDKSGNIYFTGFTNSTSGISTSGVHQFAHGGNQAGYESEDAFLVKMNAAGGRVWGTYYGHDWADIAYAVTCDAAGNIYIGGHTKSDDKIASTGAFNTTPSGGFLAKFNPSGTRLWGTYCGDTGWNYVAGIACDIKNNVYCVGATTSYRNIATSNSHQPNNGGGVTGVLSLQDGFLMKFNANGQQQWATYYGGNHLDDVMGVACDDRDGVYISGTTLSANGASIATSSTYQPTNSGPAGDAFLAKFSGNGVRQWGTYYGRGFPWYEELSSIQVLPNGNIYASGTRVYTGPAPLPPGGLQAFIVKLDGKGGRLWYADSICDYSHSDIGYGDGKLYFVGTTFDTNDRSTLMNKLQGPSDAFVIRYLADTAVFIPQPYTDSIYCVGDTMKIPFDVTNKFNGGNVISLQISDVTGNFANGYTLTTLATDTGGMFKYVIPDTVTAGKGYLLRVIGSTPIDTSFDNIYPIRISDYPDVGPVAIFPICANGTLQMTDTGTSPATTNYMWTGPGGFNIATKQYNRPNVQSSDSGWYVLEGDNYGCINRDSVFVQIYPKPAKPTFTTNSPVCEGDTLRIKAFSPSLGVSAYNWGFYQGSATAPVWYKQGTGGDTVIVSAKLTDTGKHRVVAFAGGCPSDEASVNIVVGNKSAPTVQVGASPSAYLGPWQAMTFSVTGFSNSGTTPTYQWKKNGTSIPGATGSTFIGITGIDLQTGDTICVEMKSSEACATPQTARSCVGVEIDLGIKEINTDASLQLYPNPNKGEFVLSSSDIFNGETVIIRNAVGQEVFGTATMRGSKLQKINLGKMPGGVYTLHTMLKGKYINMRFILTE